MSNAISFDAYMDERIKITPEEDAKRKDKLRRAYWQNVRRSEMKEVK